MNVGDVFKWALTALLALVLWEWLRGGVSANIAPGAFGAGNNYPVVPPGSGYLSGWIPFGAGQGNGITFGANVPIDKVFRPAPPLGNTMNLGAQ